MGSEIDARLARFGPRDVTVLGTNGLLRVLPHAEPLPPVQSMAEVTAALLGAAPSAVVQRAEAIVADEAARKALWLTTGLDAGDGIITVFSSIRSAIALYMGRHGGKQAPVGWATHQAGDAALKAIALGYLLDLCFPGSEDPVLDLARLPAGRALLAYFAAAEVALPFVEVMVDGEHALSTLLPEHADAQARKLATIVGAQSVQAARAHLPSIAPTADALVACSADYLAPFAKSAEGTIPGAGRVVNTVGDVVAAGADVLPVYRFLGLRVVAEAAAARAAREHGIALPATGDDWIAQYVDAPRRAALPLPPSITATGWETIDDPTDDLPPTEPLAIAGAAPVDAAPALSPVVGAAAMGAAAMGAAAVGSGAAGPSAAGSGAAGSGAAGSGAMLPPPANPPAPSPGPRPPEPGAGAAVPPPLPPGRRADPLPPPAPASPPAGAAVVPPPLPGTVAASAPPATPPPLPGSGGTAAVPPPLPPEATPRPVAARPAAPGPVAPPLPERGAAPAAARPPTPPAPPVSAGSPPAVVPRADPPAAAVPPPAPTPPSPGPPAQAAPSGRAGASSGVAAPPRVAPPPRAATPSPAASARASGSGSAGNGTAPPPGARTPAPAPSAPPKESGGVSFTAIGIAVAVVLLLSCAGVAGLGGVGALFVGAHSEATDDAQKPPPKAKAKGTKKSGGKSTQKSGSRSSGKSTKSGARGSKSGKKAGTKSGRSGSRRRR